MRLPDALLIANRGEIAVRIIATCRTLGIPTIALASDPDRHALHTRLADHTIHLPGSTSTDTYLNIPAILSAAAPHAQRGTLAVHPGYGFLSENPDFAQACLDAGLLWIGPPPTAMRTLGNKIQAKHLADQIGVPIAPGYRGTDQTPATLAHHAAQIGYPLLIKAAAGGGGRGMRLVTHPDHLPDALAASAREARAAFGDHTLFLERYLTHARHIEIQILADHHGTVLALGERDCTLQRRHQKVIEEAPAPTLTPALRAQLADDATRLARAAGYQNAGTVEFLLSPDHTYAFLEVNTRLQVEHPVTEAILGLDLIAAQIHIATGGELRENDQHGDTETRRERENTQTIPRYEAPAPPPHPDPHPAPNSSPQPHRIPSVPPCLRVERLGQSDPPVLSAPGPRGHAIEARLYAEDPAQGFLPSPGRLIACAFPHLPGVRIDTGVQTGDEISIHYDPLIAKIIAHGADRAQATARLADALTRTHITGPTTNLPYLQAILAHPHFASADLHTRFLEDAQADLLPPTAPPTANAAHHPPDRLHWIAAALHLSGLLAEHESSAPHAQHTRHTGTEEAPHLPARATAPGDRQWDPAHTPARHAPAHPSSDHAPALPHWRHRAAARTLWLRDEHTGQTRRLTLMRADAPHTAHGYRHPAPPHTTPHWHISDDQGEPLLVSATASGPELTLQSGAQQLQIQIARDADTLRLTTAQQPASSRRQHTGTPSQGNGPGHSTLEGASSHTFRRLRPPTARPTATGPGAHHPVATPGTTTDRPYTAPKAAGAATPGAHSLTAPMPGVITKIHVRDGEHVSTHQPLLVLEAMKMEHIIAAPGPSIIRRIHQQAGALVSAGTALIDLTPD